MGRRSRQGWREQTRALLQPHTVQSFKVRFRAFSALAAAGLLIAFVPPYLIDTGLRMIWRPEGQSLMWWAAPSGYAVVLMIVGLVLATVLGLIGLATGRASRTLWRILAVFGLLWLPAPFLAAQAVTVVHEDRIEQRGSWSPRPKILPLTGVASSHVGCAELSRGRRRTPVPAIAYILVFQNGETVDLGKGIRRRDTDAVRSWLAAVETLDERLIARGVPKVRLRDAEGAAGIRPMCLRGLSDSLGQADFDRARRVLMVEDADLYRYGLDPKGVW